MHHPTMSKYYFEHDFTEFEEFITSYPAHHKYYEKGDIISAQSETLKYGYYLKQGIIKLSIGHEGGKEKIAALFGPGSFFPLGIDQHYYDMEYAMVEQAYTEVEAYEFDYRIVRTMFLEHQDLALRMMEHYCDFTSYLFFEIASLSGDNSMAKVCNVLYALHNTSLCRSHVLHISQDDVMELSGISKIQVAVSIRRSAANISSRPPGEESRSSIRINSVPIALMNCDCQLPDMDHYQSPRRLLPGNLPFPPESG